jgi:hypothetical protein
LTRRRNPPTHDATAQLRFSSTGLLAEYQRKLAKEAVLDVQQQYHADLAQRLADEAALIPRRAAILERLHEREQQQRMRTTSTNDVVAHGVLHYSASSATRP